jgi:hypothetical protein
MAGKALMTVSPFYGDVPRIGRGDRATIRLIAIEANASADL